MNIKDIKGYDEFKKHCSFELCTKRYPDWIGCVWQVGIQPARQRKSNHFGSEIQPPYCSAIALSNVANGNSAHHA